ncbi:MAG: ABC transporter permease [Gemmatimonadota bacterium]
MSALSDPIWRRYRRFFGPKVQEDVAEELKSHLEMREEDYVKTGMDPASAREKALRRFGNFRKASAECVEIGQRHTRGTRRRETLDAFRHDVMYALRQLRRGPGFALVVILVLALGIGVNLTILGLVDTMLLHPLPGIAHTERLVSIDNRSLSYPSFKDLQRAQLFDGIGAYRTRMLSLRQSGEPALAKVGIVSGNYFTLLGARPGHGRLLQPSDDQPGAPAVTVVSAAYWRRAFAADPAVVGKTVSINGQPFTIIGVGGAQFRGLDLTYAPDVWIPVALWPAVAPTGFDRLGLEMRSWGWIKVFGVLKPGVNLAQGQASLNAVAREIQAAYPTETSTDYSMVLVPSSTGAIGNARDSVVNFFVVLLIVVGLVLLLAAANVANLLLARATHRRREIGVRLALGAGSGRIIRQFLTEALVLSTLAGVVAIGFMVLAMRLLGTLTLPGGMTVAELGVSVDPRVLLAATAAILVTGVFLGVVPAAHTAGFRIVPSLRESGSAGRQGRSRLQSSLLAVQVALSLVLLITAGLFGRSLQRALNIDPGFRTDHLVSASVDVGLARYTPVQSSQFLATAQEQVARLPGVTSVGWSTSIPLTDGVSSYSLDIAGYLPAKDEVPEVETNLVSSTFLQTLSIPIQRGTGFDSSRPLGSPRTVIVNEAMAKRYWNGREALGGRIMLMNDTLTVIGIARDAQYHTLTDPATPLAYIPLAQRAMETGEARMTLFVRTTGNVDALVPLVRQQLRSIAPEVPVFDIGDFQDRIGELLLPQRLGVQLLGAFGLLALIIASVGVYGVVGYVVARRTREVGIRMALGEAPGALVRRMVRDNLGSIVIGLIVGAALAAVVGRAAVSFLYGVSPTDPVTYVLTALILLAASLLAAFLPARRAARVSPMNALRSD